MKVTIDIPDDLYRRVKAKSALEDLTVKELTTALYRAWVAEEVALPSSEPAVEDGGKRPAWFGGARTYAQKIDQHDLDSIRSSIAAGRERERETE